MTMRALIRGIAGIGRFSHHSRFQSTYTASRPTFIQYRDPKKHVERRPEWLSQAAAAEDVPATPSTSAPTGGFSEFGIDERLLANLGGQGITEPTDVQKAAIPSILTGENVAVQCYTGSGKTLAYLLPVLSLAVQRSEAEWSATTRKTAGQAGSVHAVVVAPSRELAMQIVRVAQSLLPESAKKAVQQAIGGANINRQRESLKMYKPILVVGTPGRLAELSRDGSLMTHRCGILVLDEADQLLAPQFREEMARVTDHTGKKCDHGRQTILVSATLTPRVLALSEPWCPHPKSLFIGASGVQSAKEHDTTGGQGHSGQDLRDASSLPLPQKVAPSWGWGVGTADIPEVTAGIGSAGGFGTQDVAPAIAPGLEHYVVVSAGQHRTDTLRRAIHALDAQKALVFMNFQHRLKEAEVKLSARKGMKVGSLHGEMTKQERQSTLKAFKDGKFRALLVSDVAARGLDVPGVDAVFNLELPTDAAHYAHRAGRTGRAGAKGMVVTIATEREIFVVEKLGNRLGVEIPEVKVTHGDMYVAQGGEVLAEEGEKLVSWEEIAEDTNNTAAASTRSESAD